jgi:hypothetical protein
MVHAWTAVYSSTLVNTTKYNKNAFYLKALYSILKGGLGGILHGGYIL